LGVIHEVKREVDDVQASWESLLRSFKKDILRVEVKKDKLKLFEETVTHHFRLWNVIEPNHPYVSQGLLRSF